MGGRTSAGRRGRASALEGRRSAVGGRTGVRGGLRPRARQLSRPAQPCRCTTPTAYRPPPTPYAPPTSATQTPELPCETSFERTNPPDGPSLPPARRASYASVHRDPEGVAPQRHPRVPRR